MCESVWRGREREDLSLERERIVHHEAGMRAASAFFFFLFLLLHLRARGEGPGLRVTRFYTQPKSASLFHFAFSEPGCISPPHNLAQCFRDMFYDLEWTLRSAFFSSHLM